MIRPQEFANYFEVPCVATFGARCPICRMGSLRIYASAGETKFRCLNGCARPKILARVGLSFSDLRPEKPAGLTAGLTSTIAEQSHQPADTRSTEHSAAPLTPVQDAVEGGE